MKTARTHFSCGAQELFELKDVGFDTLKKILNTRYQMWGLRRGTGAPEPGELSNGKIYAGETVVFSDANSIGNGQRLAELIKKYGLGEVTSLTTENPNTLRKITTWLWVYNGKVLEKADAR